MFLTHQFKTNLKKNLQFSNLLPQLILIFLFCYIIYFFTKNTQINLTARNLDFGFDFLSTNSGFDVQFSLIQYDGSSSYFRSYLVGLLNTLLVSFIGIIFATIFKTIPKLDCK
jgi:general L-amino acid transport system permease protein